MKPTFPRPPKPGRSAALGPWSACRRRAAVSLALGALALADPGRVARAAASSQLPRPHTILALLEQSAIDGRPIVALFSIPGCPWCEAIRREQLHGLAREQDTRGIRVVEFDMNDERPFDAASEPNPGAARTAAVAASTPSRDIATHGQSIREAQSAAGLARALAVRIAPTVVFLGPRGELAERLVGYGSPDFFSAYLEDRIERSRAALASIRPPTKR